MTKGEMFLRYRNMSNEDRGTFERWMRVNLIAGALFCAALVAMAVPAAYYAPGPRTAQAQETPVKAPQSNRFATVPMPDRAMSSGEDVTK